MSLFWAVVFVLMMVIELATAGLTTCWFAAGALIAFIVALFCESVIIQFVVFLVVSVLLLVFTRPLLKKAFKVDFKATNYDRCIGRVAVTEETVDNIAGSGMIKIDGVEWSARSKDDDVVIPAGVRVKIIKIEGVKAFVERAE